MIMRDADFPEGRNPWRDLYLAPKMKEFAGILRIGKLELPALRSKLRNVASRYILEQTESKFDTSDRPSGLKYSDRSRWLRKNVSSPARQLALALEQRPYFSLFPNLEQAKLPRRPSFYQLATEIEILERWTDALAKEIDALSQANGHVRPASKPITDLKYALVWDLLDLYVTIPTASDGAKRSPSMTNERSDRGKQEIRGEFVEFVRAAAQPILNTKSNLTAEIRSAI
jgi:hypothetical protein